MGQAPIWLRFFRLHLTPCTALASHPGASGTSENGEKTPEEIKAEEARLKREAWEKKSWLEKNWMLLIPGVLLVRGKEPQVPVRRTGWGVDVGRPEGRSVLTHVSRCPSASKYAQTLRTAAMENATYVLALCVPRCIYQDAHTLSLSPHTTTAGQQVWPGGKPAGRQACSAGASTVASCDARSYL